MGTTTGRAESTTGGQTSTTTPAGSGGADSGDSGDSSGARSPCGFQPADVSVNGVVVGSFTVAQGTLVIDQTYPILPSIVGPTYTVRYETTMTVAPGCGSAGYDVTTSTVTFHGG